jgi:hypothetical protein
MTAGHRGNADRPEEILASAAGHVTEEAFTR